MAPQKVYTIGVSNKFAAFGDDSSSDEEGGGSARKASKKEKNRSGGGDGKNSSSGLPSASGGGSSNNYAVTKENRSPDAPGGHYDGGNRYDGDRFRGPRFDGPRAGGIRENGDRGSGFRGGRGGGDRGAFRGRDGYRGGVGGFRRGGANVQRTSGYRDGEDSGFVEVSNHDHRQRVEPGFRRGIGGSRGGRGGSGGGDRSGGFGRYGRDFDRHSGTGRGAEVKKDGGGGHNWGNEEEDWGSWLNDSVEKPQATQSVEDPGQAESSRPQVDENGEVVENGVAQAEEEVSSKREEEPEMLDLDAYRAEQRAKRANLPQVNQASKTGAKITTVKELEAQGYTRHVKRSEDEESDEGDEDSSDEETDSDEDQPDRKKKTMNVYEYIHNEGGRVRLFPGRRGGRGGWPAGSDRRSPRGGGSGSLRGGGSREGPLAFGSRRGRYPKGKDAPDIQDERAFPKLG